MADNKNIVLVTGRPNTGKTASLRNLNQEKWANLNADMKETPFRDRFAASVHITDALDIIPFIQEIETNPDIEGGILDTLTHLMTMYERQYVLTATNTQKAWGDYGNFYRELIHTIKAGTKNYAILSHEDTQLNEQAMQMETRVPVKGQVGKIGVEADFTIVVTAKQMPVKVLEKYENDLLNITDEEREDGLKYVFITRATKEYAGGLMRAPMGLWKRNELYIDNDLNLVFQRLKEYYG